MIAGSNPVCGLRSYFLPRPPDFPDAGAVGFFFAGFSAGFFPVVFAGFTADFFAAGFFAVAFEGFFAGFSGAKFRASSWSQGDGAAGSGSGSARSLSQEHEAWLRFVPHIGQMPLQSGEQ